MSGFRTITGRSKLTLLLAIIFIFGGVFTFTKLVRSSADQNTTMYTELDFSADPGLFATPDNTITATFLESPLSAEQENDTGGVGFDVIPYTFPTTLEQTYCWEDDNPEAQHYMTLVNSDNEEVLSVVANGECVTETLAPGDYFMYIYHDGNTDERIAVFVAPEEGQLLLSTTNDETLQNVITLLNTNACAGCDLSGANLSGLDLSGLDFSGANLEFAILVDANLSGTDLSNAKLINADMSRANLKGANLKGADLTSAILINADLTNADLLQATLKNVDTTDAVMKNTNPTGAVQLKADAGVDIGEADLTAVNEEVDETMTEICSGGTLDPGDGTKDLLIAASCDVGAGVFQYRNVNIINEGTLTFLDEGAETHFWAKSILVESGGTLTAGTNTDAGAFGAKGGTLTIHLYGSDSDKTGIVCKSPQQSSDIPCGIDKEVWISNGSMKVSLPGGVTDYFYQYEPPNNMTGETGLFGRKVLAASYNGTLRLFGKKGATYREGVPNWDSGTSWVRLRNDRDANPEKTVINLDRDVQWEVGDRIVITTTDYLPGHSEELQIVDVLGQKKLRVTIIDPITNMPPSGCEVKVPNPDTCGLRYAHNGDAYPDKGFDFKSDALKNQQLDIKLIDGGVNNGKPLAETRAAVALLTRSIRIVSAGDDLPAAEVDLMCTYQCFPKINVDGQGEPTATQYYYGGHTQARQGVKEFKVQGVEFYQLGQGGRKGRYPVHFHLLRKTPPDVYAKDNSVHDSMTRWYTIHGTQGVTLSRNVGFKSIGHGYYLEDGTETDNELYSNIGIFARAAIDNIQNPRKVPGILAYTKNKVVTTDVPYHSDYAQPTVFWIMNGWNDIEYNMAAGANACGVCYWWLPGAISGLSQKMKWEFYASQQSNLGRAGDTPLMKFKGNYCSSAMNAFNPIQDISSCLGVGGPGQPIFEPITAGNLSPEPKRNESEQYYPKVNGAHHPTRCEKTDCSTVPTCSAGDRKNCMVTVIDRFTTAFNWAETNFSAIWLRPQWYLVINSVISDVQNAGLTFVTGGDYTVSNFIPGQWQLARQNVFIGQTQPDNPLASAAGPVNKDTSLTCENLPNGSPVGNYCFLRDEGISIPLSNFANNQRLFNVYDGPSFEDSNAFFNIKKTFIDNCNLGQGNCATSSKSMYGRVPLMPYDKDAKQCYLPNAAIAWKQPNGFYYPPAFHSSNLFFRKNVDIRHFVIEPLFKPDSKFAFQSDDDRVRETYCTFTLNNPEGLGGSFGNFSAIDRQTILNDDDGSLTGLIHTVSVNEDPFFNAPTETLECRSEETAKTSPYDYVTTVVYPGCVAKGDCGGHCSISNRPCADTSQCDPTIKPDPDLCVDTDWTDDCGSSFCYGVPLYRQFLAKDEADRTKGQEIRMMGMNFFQRSNLTANHGTYYIDTTVSKDSQKGGLLLAPGQQPSLNVFRGGETYYVLSIFAKDTTRQTYLIYVGEGFDPENNVNAISSGLKSSRPLDVSPITWPAEWERQWYMDDPSTGILEVMVDMSAFKTQFDNARMDRCKPESFCTWTGSAQTGECECQTTLKTTNKELYDQCIKPLGDNENTICSWSVRAVDCPKGGCLGFSFTLPDSFEPQDLAPPAPCCYPDNSDWNVKFDHATKGVAGEACFDPNPPTPEFCTSPMCPTPGL